MNITLPCRGSKREQARPPICAARRRALRRAGCRDDQTNAALTHAFGPIGRTAIDAADLVLVALAKLAPHHLVAPPALFLRVVGDLGFHYIAVERALLVEQVDAVERKPCAQWSPPGQYRSP